MNALDKALQAITDHKDDLVAVVVHLNDTYLIDARPERKLPGFARIIATIRRLRAHTLNVMGKDRVLVVHSGDFLSPSLVSNSKTDHGRTMIKLLNAAGVNYCVLGNHEFDYGVEKLADRLREANFKVLLANTREDPISGKGNIETMKYAVWPENDSPPRIALTGVVSADVHKSFVSPHKTKLDENNEHEKVPWEFIAPNEAVIKAWNDIKEALHIRGCSWGLNPPVSSRDLAM